MPSYSDNTTEGLLPLADARRWFLNDGLTALEIAARCGLTPTQTRIRLTEAVLLPLPTPAASVAPASTRAAEPILDASQQIAASTAHGPLLLGAGPGTGKTKTLVARCQYLTQAQDVLPEHILALTFSNKAAQEMRERLVAAGVGTQAHGPWVGTFHAFGLELLRAHGERIGLSSDFMLLDTLDCAALLENNLALLSLDVLDNLHNPALNLGGIVKAISRAKDELYDPARYLSLVENEMQPEAERAAAALSAKAKPLQRDKDAAQKRVADAQKARETAHCYGVYQQLLTQQNAVDYGDLISQSVALLENHADIRAAWQARFPHILADEYQDVNRACARLVRLLAGDNARGLWAVGDHRQSIYRFRGASPANVASFEQDYPGGIRRELVVNYRSVRLIVDCFGAAAAEMGGAPFSGWQAQRGHGAPAALPPITFAVSPDEEAQAAGIARCIVALQAEGRPLREMALLCAAHRHAQALAVALARHGIPLLYGGSLLDRPEIKNLLAVLALAVSGQDTAFLRVVTLPEYGMRLDDARALLRRLPSRNITESTEEPSPALADTLADPAFHEGLAPETVSILLRLSAHLSAIAEEFRPADALRRYLFDASSFLRYLPADPTLPFARVQQHLAIFQLLEIADNAAPSLSIAAFLASLRRRQAMGDTVRPPLPEAAEALDAVRVLTAHGAKGLEFPVVFVPFLSAGEFPSRGFGSTVPEPPGLREAVADETSQDECLFFVALSRARDHLVVSRSETKNGRTLKPSPLLETVRAWREAQGLADTEWPPAPQTLLEDAPLPPDRELSEDLPLFSASALEQYQRCPRQYFYAHEMNLAGAPSDSGYPKFHACLHDTLAWLRDSHLAGNTPDETALRNEFARIWADRGPTGHRHEARYWESARSMLLAAHARGQEPPARLSIPLVAHLGNCRVRVTPDAAFDDADGTLVLTRHRTGKASDDDHRHIRLALMRRAANDTAPARLVRIALRYLRDGTDREVPGDIPGKRAWEPDRLAKYEAAAEGIRLRVFPPSAQGTDTCAECPYALLCPL